MKFHEPLLGVNIGLWEGTVRLIPESGGGEEELSLAVGVSLRHGNHNHCLIDNGIEVKQKGPKCPWQNYQGTCDLRPVLN